MAVVANALIMRKQRDDQVAWRLLRAANAPVIIAILSERFNAGQQRIPVPDFINMVEADLEELRYRTDFEIVKSAQAYCEDWRAAGYLVRRPMQQKRQETYELSQGAAVALSFAQQFTQVRHTATQSRLSTIIAQIEGLVLETSATEAQRRKALLEERARIDAQLAKLDRGEMEVIDGPRALEKTRDIIDLAQAIPTDFLRVRDDFERINKSIHETIIGNEAESKDILRDIFDGVDTIAQTPSGQSFRGFYELLRNTESTEKLRDDIDAILASDFSAGLSQDERRFLRGLIDLMVDRSQEVNSVMTSFARSLRRFVQSQSYQQDRALKHHIDQALGKAHRVMRLYPQMYAKVQGISLDLTSVSLAPISRYALYNPQTSKAAPLEQVQIEQTGVTSLEELRAIARLTEIDFHELAGNVNAFLQECRFDAQDDSDAGGPAGVSIARVLERYPATQGVASVVGLMVLAQEQGRSVPELQRVAWRTQEGMERSALIEGLEFYREVEA